uniref:Uncharacterized protein n=1 Tax=Arundo donax TaxID=35708 RepID=A0A0A8ZY72_ARUDO
MSDDTSAMTSIIACRAGGQKKFCIQQQMLYI